MLVNSFDCFLFGQGCFSPSITFAVIDILNGDLFSCSFVAAPIFLVHFVSLNKAFC